ncbi:phage tail protein [Bacillus gobiensis]|uniref:phage tail protein n=1 Tax=Bacillus gobiensis TaxID=1441095 RepID=UPI003D248E8C
MDLYIEDLNGNQFFALGDVEEKARVNGEKEITVSFTENKVNSKFIRKLDHRWIIGYEGEEYVVLIPRKRTNGSKLVVEAPAVHKFFIDMRDSQQYQVQNGSKTFAERLEFIFEGTGYQYNIVDNFLAQEMENFGDADKLELFQQALNSYSAEFEIVNNIVYLKNQIGIDSNAFYEHKVNLTDIQINVDGTSFATYGRGYGKIKEETDVLTSTKIPYASRTGTYYIEPGMNKRATDQVGATFSFSFNGTGFNFYTIAHFLGGKWQFNVDGKEVKTISTYQDVTSVYKTYEIVRGLENKSHNVKATFTGKDSNNPYTKGLGEGTPKPHNYLLDGNIFTIYRALVGDEIYTCTTEYTSPLASLYQAKYGLIEFPAIRDEKYTNANTLYQRVKREVDESLKVEITVDGTELKVTNPGDRIFLMDERVDLDLEVRVIEVTKKKDINGRVMEHSVTLSNDGIIESFQSRMETAAKQIRNLYDGKGNIPYNVLPATVKAYSESLKKAQTELVFDNGLIGIDKTNANNLVVFNSAGLGISTNGGESFKTALTAQGIVADVITTGQLNANNVDVINLNVDNLVGNKATFVKDGFNGINSHVSIDANRILVVGNAGDTAKITNLGEFRSDSSSGRYVLMGNGRLQSYNNLGSSLFSLGAELIGGVNGVLAVTHNQSFSIGRYDDFFLTGSPTYHPYMTLEYDTPYAENTGFVRFNKSVRFASGKNLYMGENDITGVNATHYLGGSFVANVATGGQFKVNAGSKLRLTVGDTDIMTFDSTYGYMNRNLSMEGNSITNQSDGRLKKNIENTTVDALSSINSWNFVDYEWIDTNKPQGVQFGLIAQDTPEIMIYDENRDVYSIDSSIQIMFNSYAIQQLHNKVLDLENRMSQLEVSE